MIEISLKGILESSRNGFPVALRDTLPHFRALPIILDSITPVVPAGGSIWEIEPATAII
jgi:hypothetical protein